jgi:hypothetical protein
MPLLQKDRGFTMRLAWKEKCCRGDPQVAQIGVFTPAARGSKVRWIQSGSARRGPCRMLDVRHTPMTFSICGTTCPRYDA